MAKVYQIKNTAGDRSITILPLGINGSNKSVAASDINLIGQGSTLWGDDLNESLYRMTENFACPPKAGSPAASRLPQDESDLGTGLGINNPIPGQLWFNTSTQKVYVYSDLSEKFESITNLVAGPTEPSDSPSIGDLWYDTSLPQLKIWNGGAWTSTAERYLLLSGASVMAGNLNLGGNAIVNVADVIAGSPAVNGQYAANVNYVDQLQTSLEGGLLDPLYVNITGDTMTGTLTLDGVSSSVVLNGAGGSLASHVRMGDGAGDNGIISAYNSVWIVSDYSGASGGANSIVFATGADGTSGATSLATIQANGLITSNIDATTYETFVVDDAAIPNKKYVDGVAASATPTGSMQMFAGSSAPTGYLLCDGSSVSTATYAALFAVIGYTYGGSGASFNLPDMRGRMPAGVGTTNPTPSYGGKTISLAQKAGQWNSKLTSVNQMPSHNHGGGSHRHYQYRNENTSWRPMCSYPNNTPAVGGTGAGGPDDIYATAASNSTTEATCGRTSATSVIVSQGASAAFATYPPLLGVNFIIKT